MSELPATKDVLKYTYLTTRLDYKRSKPIAEYFIKRRDDYLARIDFGLITLNGASLVALLTILGSTTTSSAFHLSSQSASYSAVAFSAGVITASYCTLRMMNLFFLDASQASRRTMLLERQLGFLEEFDTKEIRDKLTENLKNPLMAEPVAFSYSKSAIALRSLAGGLWLFGIVLLIQPLVPNPLSAWLRHGQAKSFKSTPVQPLGTAPTPRPSLPTRTP